MQKEKVTIYVDRTHNNRIAVKNRNFTMFYQQNDYQTPIEYIKSMLKNFEIEKVICKVSKLRLRLITEGFIVEK